jgi:CHAD domain-containing protein
VNEAVFVAARVPEALHQMRVATRRLLSLISFCEELFSKQERATLDAEIRRAFKTFGRARDLDIVLMALEKADAREIPLAVLDGLRRKREAAYARVIDMVTSQRFCLRMLDLLAFVECGSWAKAESASRRTLGRQQLHIGAARILQRQWKRLGKFGRVSHLDAKKRHKLRIDAKTFRDTCEFFGDLFTGPKPSRRRKQLLKSLYTLQDALGALNDRVSMEEILDQEPGAKGAHLLKLAGLDDVSKRALLESGGKAQRRLFEMTPFWV